MAQHGLGGTKNGVLNSFRSDKEGRMALLGGIRKRKREIEVALQLGMEWNGQEWYGVEWKFIHHNLETLLSHSKPHNFFKLIEKQLKRQKNDLEQVQFVVVLQKCLRMTSKTEIQRTASQPALKFLNYVLTTPLLSSVHSYLLLFIIERSSKEGYSPVLLNSFINDE